MAAKVLIFISTAWVVAHNVPVVCADEVPVMDFCPAEDADADVAFLFQKKLRTTEAQDVSPNLWQPTDGASNVALDFLDDPRLVVVSPTCSERFSMAGTNYRGCQDHTVSGFECQKWTVQSPHEHRMTPNRKAYKGLGDHNYCRNPGHANSPDVKGAAKGIWCYTTDADKRWDWCEPKISCDGYMEYMDTINRNNYRGCQDRTKNGFECQKWTSQSPHTHSMTKIPAAGLGDHNYCRNPDRSDTIWCYTTAANKRWDYCELSCNEFMSGNRKDADYRGCQDRTKNGFECQKWTSQSPHKHTRTPTDKPHAGLGDHNYCRNPDGSDTIWCYTTDANKRWDYCNSRDA